MKKRAMKKYIPKNTLYCYSVKYTNGKRIIIPCKWWSKNKNKNKQENGYCSYLKVGDWQEKGTCLLWDQCKECSISEKELNLKDVGFLVVNNKKIRIVDFI